MIASFLISMMDMVAKRVALKAHPNLQAPIFLRMFRSVGIIMTLSRSEILKIEHQG